MINAGSSANSIASPNDDPKIREGFGNHIEIKPDGSFSGWTRAGRFCGSDSHYKLFVAGKFNRPFDSVVMWQDDSVLKDAKSATGKHTGAWVDFNGETERMEKLGVISGLGMGSVELKVGISYVSEEGALANLNKEIPNWNFDEAHENAHKTWSALLNRVAVEGGTPDQRKIFYTGVYHSFLSPTLFSDEDGQYMGFDDKVHSLAGTNQKTQYANFSDWDIYRNTVQLQALFEPERESDMMQSLVNDAEQSGWLPRWPAANDVTYVMGGDSPAALLASSLCLRRAGTSTLKRLSSTW